MRRCLFYRAQTSNPAARPGPESAALRAGPRVLKYSRLNRVGHSRNSGCSITGRVKNCNSLETSTVRDKEGKCPSRQLTNSSRPWHTPPAKLGSHQNSPATNPTRAVGPIPPIPCRQACRTRFAREARKSQKEIHSTTYTLQPHRQRSPACAATFTLSRPPRTPARRNRSRRRASSRVRASPRATDGMQKTHQQSA